MIFSSLSQHSRRSRYRMKYRLVTLADRNVDRVSPPRLAGVHGRCRQVFYAVCLLCAATVQAQQSERFGPYELHYSVVNTTFLQPETAAAYNITRGRNRAIINLAVRQHGEPVGADNPGGGTRPRAMELEGRTWDLLQTNQPLVFREVREGPAIYYLAEFKFIDEEWRFFEIKFKPEGAERAYRFEFKHQVYHN